MKIFPTKKPIGFITQNTIWIIVFLFLNSCQKERSTEANKQNNKLPEAITINSTIVYTDLIPDTIRICSGVCNKDYALDLNKDGINDFNFSVSSVLARGGCDSRYKTTVSVLPLNSNSATPSKLALNEVIGNGNLWSTGSQVLRSHYSWSDGFSPCQSYNIGQWNTTTDGYLPLKINTNYRVYFGWVRLSVSIGIGPGFIIKDYAFNASPNQSILAGQMQ